MTWNIKFGGARINYRLDCFEKIDCIDTQTAIIHLGNIASLIKEYKPDVLFIQELDRDSRRSAYVDQLKYLVDSTYLNYGTFYPIWNTERSRIANEKDVTTGSAIFSTRPIEDVEVIHLASESMMDRHILKANVKIGQADVSLMNVHAVVGGLRKNGIKKKKIKSVEQIMNEVSKEIKSNPNQLIVLGGDFNNVPYSSAAEIKAKDFEDAICCWPKSNSSDHTKTKDLLMPFYSAEYPLKPVITNPEDPSNNTCSLSENVQWSRKLDYIFTNIEIRSATTIQKPKNGRLDPMKLSDHAPIIATLKLK